MIPIITQEKRAICKMSHCFVLSIQVPSICQGSFLGSEANPSLGPCEITWKIHNIMCCDIAGVHLERLLHIVPSQCKLLGHCWWGGCGRAVVVCRVEHFCNVEMSSTCSWNRHSKHIPLGYSILYSPAMIGFAWHSLGHCRFLDCLSVNKIWLLCYSAWGNFGHTCACTAG